MGGASIQWLDLTAADRDKVRRGRGAEIREKLLEDARQALVNNKLGIICDSAYDE